MRRTLSAIAFVALALPAVAMAKGATEVSVTGPGLDEALVIRGGEGPGSPLGDLAIQSGLIQGAFRPLPNPMLARRPDVELGPKYTAVYTMPGPNNELDQIRQDIYPYARPYPVTYMKPGQPFFGTERTRGGWYRATPALREVLVDAGLPSASPGSGSGSREWTAPAGLAAIAAVLAALLAAGIVLRRRAHPALTTRL